MTSVSRASMLPGAGAPELHEEEMAQGSVRPTRAPSLPPSEVVPEGRSLLGGTLERSLRAGLESLPSEATATVRLGESLCPVVLPITQAAEVEVSVTRLPGGRYEATVGGELSLGLGERLIGNKVGIDVASGGKVTFRFDSAAEAADRLSALAQVSTRMAAGSGGLVVRVLEDDEVDRRAAASVRNVVAIEGSVQLTAGVAAKLGAAGAGAELSSTGRVRYDVAGRTITLTRELTGGLEAVAPGQTSLAVLRASAPAGLSASMALETTLSLEEWERRSEGGPRRILTEALVARLAGQVEGVRVEAEQRVSPDARSERGDDAAGAGFQLKLSRLPVSSALELHAPFVGVEASFEVETPFGTDGDTGRTSLVDLAEEVRRRVAEDRALEAHLRAQRALAL